MRRLMNLWPPLAFAGVRILEWDEDYTRVLVRSARPGRLNGNMFGTQYGGTLFTMTDPFFAILMLEQLGREYNVWDRRAEIEFVSPGRTAVTAEIAVSAAEANAVRQEAANGERVLRWFTCEIVDASGGVVAVVRKQLHITRKRR